MVAIEWVVVAVMVALVVGGLAGLMAMVLMQMASAMAEPTEAIVDTNRLRMVNENFHL